MAIKTSPKAMKDMGDSGTFGSQKTMDTILKNKNKPTPVQASQAPKYSSKGVKTKLANAASKAFGGR